MGGRKLFLLRIQALRQELDRAEQAIGRIDPELVPRVRAFFDSEIEECRGTLKELAGEIEKAETQKDLRAECLRLDELTRCTCLPLFRECLTLVEGALMRGCFSRGLCKIADTLLHGLSGRIVGIHWNLFTILSHEEFIPMRDAPEIIRLRFPDVSVWDLPIAAHEFGHFVGFKLEAVLAGEHYHPFLDFIERRCNQDKERCSAHLHEYFADLFATYTLGPSYVFNCILLRFDPLKAYEESDSHPCQAKRVYWLLKALDELDDAGTPNYGAIISSLRNSWEKATRAARISDGSETPVGEKQIQQLDDWFEDMYPILDDRLRVVRYKTDDWYRAKQLKYKIDDGNLEDLGRDVTLIDLINGFWYSRMDRGVADISRIQRLGKQAVELCYLVKDRRVST
jgi:hypothetical protein